MTKLANILWTKELQKRLSADEIPIIAVSLHPGAVNTFGDKLPYLRAAAEFFMRVFYKAWDQGAYNSVFAAASPTVRERQVEFMGGYIKGDYGMLAPLTKHAQDPEMATELWETTERFLESIGLD